MVERTPFEDAYRLTKSEALTVRHPTPGLIWAEGGDRLDLLNRMSTNQLTSLPTGQGRATVLTNPVGQTIDVLQVLALEDRLVLVTSPERGDIVRNWLNGYIFFQDDVRLSPFDEGWTHWGLYGPQAGQAAEAFLRGTMPPEPGGFRAFGGGFAWPADPRLRPGMELLLDPQRSGQARAVWPDHDPGTAHDRAYQVLRIERGLPQVGREIVDDTIPLEAGLREAVSFSKGCYIGQEIIARLESRGQLAKQLCGVRLDAQAAAPADLLQNGRRIGRLTSVAHSPGLGWIGLALAKSEALENDSGRVQTAEGAQGGRLVPLPFEAILS